MRLTIIAVVLCACMCVAACSKGKLLGRFAKGKHHKRGVLSSVPPYKLGYDIPVVTHSVVKPVVVSYPPAAAVTNVKVPLAHPLGTRYPVPVGLKVPMPHPHYGLKFPHQLKTVLFSKPDHFHHHHHHVAPKPVIPVVPAVPAPPVIPLAAPTATVAHPVPATGPAVLLQPAPAPAPAPVFPATGLPHSHLLHQEHTHLRPLLQTAASVPAHTPLLQYANQFQYVLRPGNAVQTSFFANYPRYPFFNYQTPVFPLAQASPAVSQVLFERPKVPHFHLGTQAGQDGLVLQQPGAHVEPTFLDAQGGFQQHAIHLQPTQPDLHLQPVQPGVQLTPDLHHLHPGQHEVHLHSTQPELHSQPGQPQFHLQPGQPEYHLQPGQQEVHLQQGQQEVHLHPAQQEVHLHQGQPEVHLHQGQPEVHLHGAQPGILQTAQPGVLPTQATVHLQPTQPTLDQDGWHPVQTQPHDLGASHPGAHFGQDGQFAQGAHFGQDEQFAQGVHFGQDGQLAPGAHFGQDGQFAQGTHFNHGQFGHNHGHHQFTQDQGSQGYDQAGEQQYHDLQNQLHHHIQQQLDQAQYDLHVNTPQQQQPGQEYGVPQFGQDNFGHSGGQDFSQPGQNFGQQGHDYNQQGQNFGQDFSQNQNGQNFGQDFSQNQNGQNFGQDFSQNQNGQNFDQDFSQQQPAAEYGVPQGAEGRSSAEGEEAPQFHNHIPLMLQPPLERPLEHFR